MQHHLNPTNWLKNHGDYLFSYCMLRVSNRENAEDLVQETFISALKAQQHFKGESSEKTWLTAILKNKITDYYRRKDVLKETQSYLEATEKEFTESFFNSSDGHWLKKTAPAEWHTQADSELEQVEFSGIMQNCIQKMPTRLVPVFIARFFNDEDAEKICKDFKISASNYWVIIHRAKVLIRSCLEKNWFLSK